MKVVVSPSARFIITNEGALWGLSPSVGYNNWSRYLDVYDEVNLLVRAEKRESPPEDAVLASGTGVQALPLPFYHGPIQYVQRYRHIQATLKHHIRASRAIVLRLPLTIASSIINVLPDGYPYGVEVVGDPYDVFGPGAVRHPLRPVFRQWFAHNLRHQCANASAAAYVTAAALQRRYPPGPNAFTTHYSSIDLTDEAFVASARIFTELPTPLRLILVGSLDQMNKAADVLIDAVALCLERGLNLHLTLVGDGKHRQELEAQAVQIGLGEAITFTGNLAPGPQVRAQLDQAHLFVLPSRQEGLPRAMIEAMARGLPCIGSTVGGIPELLSDEARVPPGNVQALADKITEFVKSPTLLTRLATENLDKARAYHQQVLRVRRKEFYQYIRDETQAWLDRQ